MKLKNVTHRLIERGSGKMLHLTMDGKSLFSETGQPGKMKITEKTFPDPEETQKNFYKKEWEALKKGFVLNNTEAGTGAPFLHLFIGGGYTGCLSFQHTPYGVWVYKNGGSSDSLVLAGDDGDMLNEVALPQMLAWGMEYRAQTDSLILDIDHYIYEYIIAKKSFHDIANGERSWESFVSVARDKTAFAANGKIYITDAGNSLLHSIGYGTETIKGNTPFCGKLSVDGNLLAFHNKVGEIQIFDTATGKVVQKIVAGFEMVDQMEFAEGNRLLIVKEKYGTWGMRYFDLHSGSETLLPGLEIPSYTKEVDGFCFNLDYSKLVLVQRAGAHVFDFHAKKLLHCFEIEHLVKSCHIKFVGDKLGVRTDYGCFSLYNV